MFIDASSIVAIINGEPGADAIEKLLASTSKKLYVSPLVRVEATLSLARVWTEAGSKTPRSDLIEKARIVIDEFIYACDAREMAVSTDIGTGAIDAARQYGRGTGHAANLNYGDCFAYACAKAYRLTLVYKGKDFAHTDLA